MHRSAWRVTARSAISLMILLFFLPGGCAAKLPTYPGLDDAAALRVIAERFESVTSAQAVAELSLTSLDGQTVTLDAALVAAPPDRVRLRAWKFGSPVLDVTVLPEGVWAFAAARPGRALESPMPDPGTLHSAAVSQSVGAFTRTFFAAAVPVETASTRSTLIVVGPAFDRPDVRCEIERATLTPRRFILEAQGTSSELLLDRYAMIDGVAWPRRMVFRSPEGSVVVRTSEIDFNDELPPNAFVPPARAKRLP